MIVQASEVGKLARPVSNHIDKERIEVYIRESEDIDLKATLGDALLIDLRERPEKYKELLDGGTYSDACSVCVFSGLKKALAYYAYARIVKNNDMNVTRFGLVAKQDDYSERVSVKEKVMAYNDAFDVADRYMRECVIFLTKNKEKYPLYKGHGKVRTNRVSYKVIGE